MFTTQPKYAVPALIAVACLGSFALGQFQLRPTAQKAVPVAPPILPSSAPAPNTGSATAAVPVDVAKPEAAPKTATAGRRREAVIKIPAGTYVKDMDVGTYGSGRLTWTFEEEKVLGTIEANVMGVDVELRTEAEYSMSSTGTIYGIVTHVELTRLKVGGGALGMLGEFGEYAKLVKLAEPLLIEMMTDLPFSYQFRVSGNKLTILNFRTLLAGPNPLGKVGGVVGGGDSGLAVLSAFQTISVALEGTYVASEPDSRDKPRAKPVGSKSGEKK
jgi:hypothetical protein